MVMMANSSHMLSSVRASGEAHAVDAAAEDSTLPTADAGFRMVRVAVLTLVNGERARAGRRPLQLNWRLNRAAQSHADDMAARFYFAHNTLDGRAWDDRVRRLGYDSARLGENIAQGQSDAEQAVAEWMDSAEHRARILDPDYFCLGVGFNLTASYWVQDFAGRRK